MSSESCSTLGKDATLLERPTGTHKVKYHPEDEWDFVVDTIHEPVDLSLILPHYRARNQPVNHRMSMSIGSESGPMKVKVCRHYPRSRFLLEVQADVSDVMVWLPSDFKGHIHHTGKATFSAGFVNRLMKSVHINEDAYGWEGDEVVVSTHGKVSFRMWDITTCAPENTQKEIFKRIFGCGKTAPETTIDWDFLLED